MSMFAKTGWELRAALQDKSQTLWSNQRPQCRIIHLGCCQLHKRDWISYTDWTMITIQRGIIMHDHDAGLYPPFCSPLQLRRSPCAPSLWTGAYFLSGKWSRQFWGGFCARSVQNSCIHIKWINCPDIKRRLIDTLPLDFVFLTQLIDALLDSLRIATIHKASHLHSRQRSAESSWSVLAGLYEREMR